MKFVKVFIFILYISFSGTVSAQCCGDGVCDPGEDATNCPYDCGTASFNCSSTIGAFNTSPTYPVNYSTANANGWCYTISGPFPQDVCFEYIVPPAGVDASVSISISGCNTATINQSNLGGGGCNTNNTTSSDISASATYDSDCNLLNTGITTGGGNCYTPGDIITICYTITGACGSVDICPVISCGSETCPTGSAPAGCPPFNFSTATDIDVCENGINSGIAVVTPDCGDHFSYLWDDPLGQTDSLATDLSPGIYNVLVTNTALGCDTTYSLVVDTIIPTLTETLFAEICQGDSLFVGGGYQNVAGNYDDTLTSVHGCDSIVTTILTVIPLASSTDIYTICGDFTWIDGVNYTSSTNTPTFTIVGGAANGCDSIVTLDLTINNVTTGTDIQTACEDFTWIDGENYTSSTNTPTFTIVGGAANGCDSIVTLDLTINNIATGTDIQTACEDFTWIDGVNYTSSTNIPTFTIVGGAANGCDSIVTLDLTINNNSTGTDIQTACEDFTWIDGVNYTSSTNTPTFTIVGGSANGCDSIVTLDLTINNIASGTDVQTVCGDFTWIDGVTYTSSTNTPTFTIVGGAANGCDSIVTLDLTINNNATSTDVQTACGDFTWIDGVNYTSSTNTPTFTIVGGAANGCDSIVTLDLTINNIATSTDFQTACGDFTWIDGVNYTSSTNTPTFTIVGGAANGCDSIVTLDLTINNNVTGTDVQVVCEDFTWIDGVNYTSSTNTPTLTIVGGAANGCDSIVTLDLTINTPSTTTNTYNECEGFSITVGTNTYNTSGVYTDVVNGCDTIITDLTINPSPTLTLIKTDENCGEENGSVSAVANSSNPPITYSWSTGSTDSTIDGLISGTYTVIVSDESGCSVTDTIDVLDVQIDCGYFVYLPNGFTPNGDQNNDILYVRGKGIASFTLNIYNRWGNKVFETNEFDTGWDGTYKGEPQNTAVFVYTIEGVFENGNSFKESGDISLMR